MTSMVAGRMAETAAILIESWDQTQRRVACRPFPDEDERRLCTTRRPITAACRSPPCARSASERPSATRDRPVHGRLCDRRRNHGARNILDQLEGWSVDFGRERGRDPLLYYITIFGEPGGDAHGGGASAGTTCRCTTPSLAARWSRRPRTFSAPIRPSARSWALICTVRWPPRRIGRELFRALDEEKRAQALVAPVAPTDLVGCNRPHLRAGDRRCRSPISFADGSRAGSPSSWPTCRPSWRRRLVCRRFHLDAAELQRRAEGDRGLDARCRPDLDPARADRLLSRTAARSWQIRARLVEEFARLYFLWAGGAERGQPHRIQGERVFIEYDNTQRGANHIHTVWRDLANDFGGDALARHYAQSRH